MNNMPNQIPGQPMPELRQCFSCYHEGMTGDSICPRCRKPKFFTSGNIRTRGKVLIGVGIFLTVLMAAVAVGVGVLLGVAMNNPESARKIRDDIGIIIGMYGLFAVLIGFGLQSIVSGGWMAISGKRNRIIVWVMWTFLTLVIIAAATVRFLLP